MDAMKRLEQAGFKFGLGDNRVAVYHFDPNDGGPPMGERPRAVQQVVYERYAADLAEVQARPDAVKAVIMARSEWGATYEDYKGWLAGRDVTRLDDEEVIQEYAYRVRLASLSEDARWPYYDGGQEDQGPQMWRLLAERLRQEYAAERSRRLLAERLQVEYAAERSRRLLAETLRVEDAAERRRRGAATSETEPTSDDKEKQTMGIRIEQTKFVVLPEGEYKLRIVEIAEAEGKFHDQLQVKLEVANGPHAGATFYSWMNRVFSPKSKLYQWVEAALAVPVPPDYDLDTDDLLEREVTGYVIVKPLDGGGEVNRVERVRAAREVNKFERGRAR